MLAAFIESSVGEIRVSNETPTHGVSANTPILTMSGAQPAEFIAPGDRIITRNGARTVREIEVSVLRNVNVIRFHEEVLNCKLKQIGIHLPDDQPVLLRDWRAQALTQKQQAIVSAHRLADGYHIRSVRLEAVRMITIRFDSPEVIYAGGLEIMCQSIMHMDTKSRVQQYSSFP